MVLGSTQPIIEMSTRVFLRVKYDRQMLKADNLTTICEPIV
jgi:hypothetical protein